MEWEWLAKSRICKFFPSRRNQCCTWKTLMCPCLFGKFTGSLFSLYGWGGKTGDFFFLSLSVQSFLASRSTIDCTPCYFFSRLQYQQFHDSVCWFLVLLLLLWHVLTKVQASQIAIWKGFGSCVYSICLIFIVTSALYSDSNSCLSSTIDFNCVIFLWEMMDCCSTHYFDNFTGKW